MSDHERLIPPEPRNGFYWVLLEWGLFECWQPAFFAHGFWTFLGDKKTSHHHATVADIMVIGKRIPMPRHYPRGK